MRKTCCCVCVVWVCMYVHLEAERKTNASGQRLRRPSGGAGEPQWADGLGETEKRGHVVVISGWDFLYASFSRDWNKNSRYFFKVHLIILGKFEQKRPSSHLPSAQHTHSLSHYEHRHQSGTSVTINDPTLLTTVTLSPSFPLGFTPGVVHCIGLESLWCHIPTLTILCRTVSLP